MSGGVYGGDEVGALVFGPGHHSFRYNHDKSSFWSSFTYEQNDGGTYIRGTENVEYYNCKLL